MGPDPKRYFTNNLPLGPNATPDDFTQEAFSSLFDIENKIFESLNRDPRILVGRKGSGKTAFLKSRQFVHANEICIELESSKAFAHVVKAVNELVSQDGIAFDEDCAGIWVSMFQMIVFRSVSQLDLKDEADIHCKGVIDSYLAGFFGKQESPQINLFLTTLIREILRRTTGLADVWETIQMPESGAATFEQAEAACFEILERGSTSVHLLIDNLEDFRLENFMMQRALTGLLKALRTFDEKSLLMKVTFCLPSELFHYFFHEISSNPLKDFERKQLIQWSGAELLHLCANRYSKFLEISDEDFYQSSVKLLDMNKKTEARHFWKLVFPEKIVNGNGIEETATAYALRHTQLSPRQIIMIFNSIISYNIFRYGQTWNINNLSFIEGIKEVEPTLCQEIFTGFRQTYPSAMAACEVIFPHLNSITDLSSIHKSYNTYGRGIPDLGGIDDLMRMLVEIGAIGLVTDETTRYTVGLFEYTSPNKLVVNTNDKLCVHPLFIRRFRVSTEGQKPIYPYGTDEDGEDYRDW